MTCVRFPVNDNLASVLALRSCLLSTTDAHGTARDLVAMLSPCTPRSSCLERGADLRRLSSRDTPARAANRRPETTRSATLSHPMIGYMPPISFCAHE